MSEDLGTAEPVRVPAQARRGFDVVALLVLTGVAYLARRGGIATDGLWFDDSWVAAGAIHGQPRGLLTVGSGHPAFTALLMGVDRLGGGNLDHLGVPSLLFGVAAPPVLYLGLRSLGYERAISGLVAAALAVAPVHIRYAGRVKGYTLDTLLVLLLAVLLPYLARRTWRWPTAVAWTVGAVGLGFVSGYTLVASAAAGVVLVLHPAGDRVLRAGAVGIQAVVQAVYLRTAQSKTDLAGIEEVMESVYDGHIEFSWNPLTLAREVLKHLRRVAEVFPGAPGDHPRILAVLAVVMVAGLVLAAFVRPRRSESIAARFLLLILVLAVVGAFVDRFPFGTSNEQEVSYGGRHTLWLVPALAVGLASSLHRLRGLVAGRDRWRLGFDAVVVALACWAVVAGYQPAPPAPGVGSLTAARFVDETAGPNDVIIITNTSTFSYAIHSPSPVELRATPDHQVGFAPVFLDPRVHNVGGWAYRPAGVRDILSWVENADRVIVLGDGLLAPGLEQIAGVLERTGRERTTRSFGWSTVEIWER